MAAIRRAKTENIVVYLPQRKFCVSVIVDCVDSDVAHHKINSSLSALFCGDFSVIIDVDDSQAQAMGTSWAVQSRQNIDSFSLLVGAMFIKQASMTTFLRGFLWRMTKQ